MSDKNLTIGVDLGGTKIAVGLCEDGEILKKTVVPTEANKGFESVIATIIDAVKSVMVGTKIDRIKGIGIGAAGQIDSATGVVVNATNLKWKDVPLGETLEKALGLPVKVLNDVRAATVAELKFGNGKGLDSFANVFIGTGIGSGFVFNGQILHGASNSAGEIGHICVEPEGPICNCGHQGCLETFASGVGMENFVKNELVKGRKSIIMDMVENDISKVRGPIIKAAADQNDGLAIEAIERIGYYLGIILANIHTLLNPEVILLGGGMMVFKQWFMPILTKTLNDKILTIAKREVLVREAKFQNDAVLLGGASLFA